MTHDSRNAVAALIATATLIVAGCGPRAESVAPPETAADSATAGAETPSRPTGAGGEALERSETAPLQTELSDTQVMVYVLAELIDSPAVAAHHVEVTVEDGVATLEGEVEHLLAKRNAVEITKHVRGVSSVIDRLTVAPTGERDPRIERYVENALLFDPAMDAEALGVDVDDGIVTVTGTASSLAEKDMITDVVASVLGVRGVTNSVGVDFPADRGSEEILEDLGRGLRSSAVIDAGLVEVSGEGADVVLSGFVGSAAERDRAREMAYRAGAASVDDSGLLVQWWRRGEMNTEVEGSEDDWIRAGLEAALRQDPRVGDNDIDISVRRGIVTLTGVVEDLATARAAVLDAENTARVERVYSYLRVRPAERLTDEILESRVDARLTAEPYTSRSNMTAEVHRGVLTLSGTVDSNFERERAEQVAARVDGLLAIENHLDIRDPGHHESDLSLAHDVAAKLERDAWVSSGSVVVSAVAGVVMLTGTVANRRTKQRAIDDAYDAGARRVNAERLVIE